MAKAKKNTPKAAPAHMPFASLIVDGEGHKQVQSIDAAAAAATKLLGTFKEAMETEGSDLRELLGADEKMGEKATALLVDVFILGTALNGERSAWYDTALSGERASAEATAQISALEAAMAKKVEELEGALAKAKMAQGTSSDAAVARGVAAVEDRIRKALKVGPNSDLVGTCQRIKKTQDGLAGDKGRLTRDLAKAVAENDRLKSSSGVPEGALLLEGEDADYLRAVACKFGRIGGTLTKTLGGRKVREHMETGLKGLVVQVGAMTAERDAVTAERDAVTAERDAVTAERDAMTAERDAVTAERDAVTAERDAMTAERDAVTAKSEAAEEEMATAKEELATAKAAPDSTDKALLAAMTAERDAVMAERDAVTAKSKAAEEALATTFAALTEAMTAERDAVTAERDKALQSLEEAQDQAQEWERRAEAISSYIKKYEEIPERNAAICELAGLKEKKGNSSVIGLWRGAWAGFIGDDMKSPVLAVIDQAAPFLVTYKVHKSGPECVMLAHSIASKENNVLVLREWVEPGVEAGEVTLINHAGAEILSVQTALGVAMPGVDKVTPTLEAILDQTRKLAESKSEICFGTHRGTVKGQQVVLTDAPMLSRIGRRIRREAGAKAGQLMTPIARR
jgi:hypothetical protein